MAIYPCDIGSHRYAQPQQTGYLTLVMGSSPASKRMRLCPKHFDEVLDWAQQELAELREDTVSPTTCDQCGDERRATVFCRLFATKQDERIFVTDLCTACAVRLGQTSPFASQEPLPAR